MHREYLGDGVYAQRRDDGAVVLTTENGVCTTNSIYLEDAVQEAFVAWLDRTARVPVPGQKGSVKARLEAPLRTTGRTTVGHLHRRLGELNPSLGVMVSLPEEECFRDLDDDRVAGGCVLEARDSGFGRFVVLLVGPEPEPGEDEITSFPVEG